MIDENKIERKKNLFSSKKIEIAKIAILIIGAILVLSIVFVLGMNVGFKKANFSYKWGENYERNFGGQYTQRKNMNMPKPQKPMPEFIDRFERKKFRNAHGIAGKILSISGDQIIIQDKDGNENSVVVDDKTVIKMRRNDLKVTDLKRDQQVVIMGRPDDNGVITADLIRIFDSANDGQNADTEQK
jgi:hypothetical protein